MTIKHRAGSIYAERKVHKSTQQKHKTSGGRERATPKCGIETSPPLSKYKRAKQKRTEHPKLHSIVEGELPPH